MRTELMWRISVTPRFSKKHLRKKIFLFIWKHSLLFLWLYKHTGTKPSLKEKPML